MAAQPERIAEIRRQLEILEAKAAQAGEPVVKTALAARVQELRKELGEPQSQAESREDAITEVAPSRLFHVLVGTEQRGPVGQDAVEGMLAANEINRETRLWTPGLAEWQPLGDFAEFAFAPGSEIVEAAAEPSEQVSEPVGASQPKKMRRPEDDVVVPPAADPVTQRKAEELIRAHRAAKMRKQSQESARLLAQAQQLAPGSADVQEAVGDDFMERSRPGEAKIAYYIATKLAPKNVQVERKYAMTVLRSTSSMSFESAILHEAAVTSDAKRAAILSGFVPGAGQFALEDYVKGSIMLSIHIGCFIVAFLIFHLYAGKRTLPGPVFWIPVGIMIVNWIVSVSELTQKAKGSGLPGTAGLGGPAPKAGDKPNRPQPPVNLPFE